jgi:hypothetical protein
MLSEAIEKSTGTRISVSTLKRVWGKTGQGVKANPVTLDTLVRFIGYTGWLEYYAEKKGRSEGLSFRKRGKTIRNLLIGGVVLLLIIAGYFSLKKIINPMGFDPDTIHLEIKDPIHTFPHTLEIFYNLGSVKKRECAYVLLEGMGTIIDTIPLDKDNRWDKTHLRYKVVMPGVYEAVLCINHQEVKRIQVVTQTKGWVEWVSERDRVKRLFLPQDTILRDGYIQISLDQIDAIRLDPYHTRTSHLYCNKQLSVVRSGNFMFEACLKNEYLITTSRECAITYITLLFERSYISFCLVNEECMFHAHIFIAKETVMQGKYHELGFLANNMHQWNKARLKSVDGKLFFSVNNSIPVEVPIEKDYGALYALKISGLGSAVDYVRVWDRNRELVYNEDFGKVLSD